MIPIDPLILTAKHGKTSCSALCIPLPYVLHLLSSLSHTHPHGKLLKRGKKQLKEVKTVKMTCLATAPSIKYAPHTSNHQMAMKLATVLHSFNFSPCCVKTESIHSRTMPEEIVRAILGSKLSGLQCRSNPGLSRNRVPSNLLEWFIMFSIQHGRVAVLQLYRIPHFLTNPCLLGDLHL